MEIPVDALCAGHSSILPSGKKSGIRKLPLAGPVAIGTRGIAADKQVNRTYHGYPAMALHHFPHETYAWLRHHFGALPRLEGPGNMGENLSTCGVTEHEVCIGDRFRFGSAVLEVTQPRQPCATIEQHLEVKGIVKALIASARTGWFYRVLEPGEAQAGDTLLRIEQGNSRWTLARAFLATYGSARAPDAELEELAGLERVSDQLIGDINKRLAR